MIEIKECGEKLFDIKEYCPDVVINLGKDRPTAYLRESVAKKLSLARKALPPNMTFIINDAFRTVSEQDEIREWYIERFKNKYPDWDIEKVKNEVNKFVAHSKGKNASGHLTGGAVDLRIIFNGRRLPMISRKLTFRENAKPYQSKLPNYLQKNREILFKVMSNVGFVNNPREYWHWSYGDVAWTKLAKKDVAIYDVVQVISNK